MLEEESYQVDNQELQKYMIKIGIMPSNPSHSSGRVYMMLEKIIKKLDQKDNHIFLFCR